ncbi:MAG TPA: hypothetical protein VIK50_17785 [Gemmatimonadaceae bacterium]
MPDMNGFVVAAYAIMWIGLIGYGVRLHRVFREARRRLDDASREGRNT